MPVRKAAHAAAPTLLLPTAGPIHATVTVPGSKSLSNRAMLLALLATGTTRLTGVLDSDDTQVMFGALKTLGIRVTGSLRSGTLTIHGCGGRPPVRDAAIFVGNSGTSARFLAAALCLTDGQYTLDGVARMRERPIRDLVDPLRKLGAAITCASNGCPPVRIEPGPFNPGTIAIRGDTSSQFLSGLLMMLPGLVAPAKGPSVSTVKIIGELVSRPYVEMTLALMAHFGVAVPPPRGSALTWKIPARPSTTAPMYRCKKGHYAVEPDASSASYFLAAAAISGGMVCVKGLPADSLQGDVGFAKTVLAPMGCHVTHTKAGLTVAGPRAGKAGARSAGAARKAKALSHPFQTPGLRGIDVDLGAMPDMAQTLAVTALFADGPTTIRGIANLRVKETDRLAALETELSRIGAKITVKRDSIRIDPCDPQMRAYKATTVKTYDDHRMAMSFALAGLKIPGMRIADPGCVAKTVPDFFTRWKKMLQGR